MQFVDLHTHSTASDGTKSPAELVRLAHAAGLAAVAVTDHDTLAGLAEAEEAGHALGIEVVRGCELALLTPQGEIHMLALWLPQHADALERAMLALRAKRTERNVGIVHKLQGLGLAINYDEVLAHAGAASVGRPHIAAIMLAKGYVPSINAAFKHYLAYGCPAYLPKEVLNVAQGLRLLRSLGASPVLAHPCLSLPAEPLRALVAELVPQGLLGLEAYHSEHNAADTRFVVGLAQQYGLALSGGSDFHGDTKPGIALGRGHGGLRVPLHVLEKLKAQRLALGLPSAAFA
ncbi:MAG: PHP domain-containing protein [Desulfovibrionaceae bacterium]|nr:PHP domain-containing protein [Desulfovibrionaceae bacterium]